MIQQCKKAQTISFLSGKDDIHKMPRKNHWLAPISHMIFTVLSKSLLDFKHVLEKSFRINRCVFWKVSAHHLLRESLKRELRMSAGATDDVGYRNQKTASKEGIWIVSKCQDGPNTLPRAKQVKSFIYFFKR